MKGTVTFVLGVIAGCLIGYFVIKDISPGSVRESKETSVDTYIYSAPVPKSELATGTHLYTLPVYRFIGSGVGGKPRQQANIADSCIAMRDTAAISDPGAGIEIRSSSDSVLVPLPTIQRHYADSIYEAWVSGPLDPRLDSIRVLVPTTVITKRDWKPPKRWHIGVTAGYGYGVKGFQPYIGVGITYSIFSF